MFPLFSVAEQAGAVLQRRDAANRSAAAGAEGGAVRRDAAPGRPRRRRSARRQREQGEPAGSQGKLSAGLLRQRSASDGLYFTPDMGLVVNG